MYSFFTNELNKNYTNITLIKNYKKILIAMTPIIPHFSSECLKTLNIEKINWPKYDEQFLKEDFINIVVQINGKNRTLINTKVDTTENDLMKIVYTEENLKKYINKENIKKTIFIKNKILNIITQ